MGRNEPLTHDARADLWPATRVRYQVLAFGCGLALLAYVQRLSFVVGGPEIKKDFGLSDPEMGYLMSVFLVAYGAFQVPVGFLGDRLGARHVLTLLVLGWSVTLGAIGLVDPRAAPAWLVLALLLTLRTVFGIFQSGAFPVFARVIADWMPVPERASAQGLLWTFSRLGGALLPFLWPFLLAWFGGWRVPFWLLSGLGLVWCAAFWPWFRNRPQDMPKANAAELALIRDGRPPQLNRSPSASWRRLLRSPSAWFLCLMYGCCGPAGNFFFSMLPIYLRDHLHLSAKTTSWLLGLPLAGGIGACFLGGLVSDWIIRRTGDRRWGRRLGGALGLATAGLSFALLFAEPEPWLLGVLLCAALFGNDFNMGPAWAACADIGGAYAGTLSGAMNMTSNITGAVGAVVAGYLFLHGHADWVFPVYGGFWVVGGLCWLGVDVTRPLTPAT
jgi:sugar phosphate permease